MLSNKLVVYSHKMDKMWKTMWRRHVPWTFLLAPFSFKSVDVLITDVYTGFSYNHQLLHSMALLPLTQLAYIGKKMLWNQIIRQVVFSGLCVAVLSILFWSWDIHADVRIQTAAMFYGDSTHVCAYIHICFTLNPNRQIEKLAIIGRRGNDWIWHGHIERYVQMGVRRRLLPFGDIVCWREEDVV